MKNNTLKKSKKTTMKPINILLSLGLLMLLSNCGSNWDLLRQAENTEEQPLQKGTGFTHQQQTPEGAELIFTYEAGQGLQAHYQTSTMPRPQAVREYPVLHDAAGSPVRMSKLEQEEAYLLTTAGRWEVSEAGVLRYRGMKGEGGMLGDEERGTLLGAEEGTNKEEEEPKSYIEPAKMDNERDLSFCSLVIDTGFDLYQLALTQLDPGIWQVLEKGFSESLSFSPQGVTWNAVNIRRLLNLSMALKDLCEDLKNELIYDYYWYTGNQRYVRSWIRTLYRIFIPFKSSFYRTYVSEARRKQVSEFRKSYFPIEEEGVNRGLLSSCYRSCVPRVVRSRVQNFCRERLPIEEEREEAKFLRSYYVNMQAMDEQKEEFAFMDFESRLNLGFNMITIASCMMTFFKAYTSIERETETWGEFYLKNQGPMVIGINGIITLHTSLMKYCHHQKKMKLLRGELRRNEERDAAHSVFDAYEKIEEMKRAAKNGELREDFFASLSQETTREVVLNLYQLFLRGESSEFSTLPKTTLWVLFGHLTEELVKKLTEEEQAKLDRVISDLENKGLSNLLMCDYYIKKTGGGTYLGAKAWQELGVELKETDLPAVSEELLSRVKAMQTKGEQPILVLDLGKSIEELEEKFRSKGKTLLKAEYKRDKKLRSESCYKEKGGGIRWLLVPGSDHGVLPGSRDKTYENQVKYMREHYAGYEVGGARELLTLYMLHHMETGLYLFPEEGPRTYGRCKEEYQVGEWKGYRIILGASGLGGLVVPGGNDFDVNSRNGLFGFLSVSS